MRKPIFFIIALVSVTFAFSQDYEPGQMQFTVDGSPIYLEGDHPYFAPHSSRSGR